MYFIIVLCISYITSTASLLTKSPFCFPTTCRGNDVGECEETLTGFVCHCTDRFKGTTCGLIFMPNDNPCSRTPCNSILITLL